MTCCASQDKWHFGIDVAKAHLDIHLAETGDRWQVANTARAIKTFVQTAGDRLAEAFITVDMAGGFERLSCDLLLAHGFAVHRAHPYRVKSFARACGQIAKTDTIDARLLALYGRDRRHDLALYQPHTAHQLALKALVERRADLVDMQTQEKNRLAAPTGNAAVVKSCRLLLATLKRQIKTIDTQIDRLIDQDARTRAKAKVLRAISGIGPQTTAVLIALMPELGDMTGKQAASITGLAPAANDSGTRRGYRPVRGGRPQLRKALFMAALSAIRHNKTLKAKYQNLIAKGKKPIVAIIAIARNLIVIANAKVRDEIYAIN